MAKIIWQILLLVFISSSYSLTLQADDKFKPFVLASNNAGDLAKKITTTKSALTKAGFEIAGEYSPYEGTHIIVVTNDLLKKAAATHKRAGYVVAQRVALTTLKDKIQISYTNPVYMAAAYHVKTDISAVNDQLSKALGHEKMFGPAEGLTLKEAGSYHYMFGMEYFTDPTLLAEHPDKQIAIKKVEKSLAAHKGGAFKVYRIDIPGTNQTLFGVGLKAPKKNGNENMDDKYIMSEIDFKPLRSSAHLPYELLVRGGKVEALYARFRIAINFPDLSMMGAHSFMNIMAAPGAINETLISVAGGSSGVSIEDF